jgi:hypothetical protein
MGWHMSCVTVCGAFKCSFVSIRMYPLLCCCATFGVADYQLAVLLWCIKGALTPHQCIVTSYGGQLLAVGSVQGCYQTNR